MDLLGFVSQVTTASDVDVFSDAQITYFMGKQYPLLCFSVLLQQLKKNTDISIETIDLDQADDAQTKSKLATSFLGMKMLYWLRNISALDKRKQKKWLTYLQEYTGPNVLMFFVEDGAKIKKAQHIRSIAVPATVDQKIFVQLMQAFGHTPSARSKQFIQKLYKKTGALSLDNACSMIRYSILLGAGSDVFLESWLEQLVAPQKSLFTLSQYFFAKNSRAFFRLWAKIGGEYADMFWVAYWSEQLWRASQYIQLLKQGNRIEARKIGYRLPFSFLQRDWQRLRVDELTRAHELVYATDFGIKNGCSSTRLELMYLNFFAGDWSKS